MRRVAIGKVAKIDRRNVAPDSIIAGTQYLGLEHVQSEGGCNPIEVSAGELGSNKFAFTPDHVLFGKLRPYLKKTTLVDFHGICSTDIIPILPDPEQIDKRYLYYFLLSENTVRKAVERCSGANLPRLSPTELAKFEIPLPPLPDQRRIAARLDAADRLRALDRALVGKYEEMKRSLFLEMFGDPVRNERGWEVKRLAELGIWRSGGTPSRTKLHYFSGSIPWYSSGELNSMYLCGAKETISEKAVQESSAKLVPPGCLLLGMYDTAALKSGITTMESSCNQAIAYGLLNSKLVESPYLYHATQQGKPTFKLQQRGVRQKNFNLSMIKQILVPVPSLNIQAEFTQLERPINQQLVISTKLMLRSESLLRQILSTELQCNGL